MPTGDVQINVGESVIRNEIVKTAAESWTKLVFSDSTNLSVGPNATVRLSNFVSAGPSSYGKATIDIAKGAFRFATGHSEKRAYEINTGVATIGVRGTVFDGDSETGSTKLHVASGAVLVRTTKGKVCEVTAGQSVVISATALQADFRVRPALPLRVHRGAGVRGSASGRAGLLWRAEVPRCSSRRPRPSAERSPEASSRGSRIIPPVAPGAPPRGICVYQLLLNGSSGGGGGGRVSPPPSVIARLGRTLQLASPKRPLARRQRRVIRQSARRSARAGGA